MKAYNVYPVLFLFMFDIYIMNYGYNFYFIHNTFGGYEKLESILNDGYVKMGCNLDEDMRVLSGGEPQPYVFANIEFTDILNLRGEYACNVLIFDKEMMNAYDIYFNKRWLSYVSKDAIKISKDDWTIHKQDKIKIIHDYLRYTMTKKAEEEYVLNKIPSHSHEVLISGDIDVSRYLIGIICHESYKKKIEKMIKKKGYNIRVVECGKDISIEDDILSHR